MIQKRFHFFGTSHTAGGGFEFHKNPKLKKCYRNFGLPLNENSFSFPGQFEKLIDYSKTIGEVVNHAKCGYGNELLYRKVFEVIENPHFDINRDILFLELSDTGRKEIWNNDIKDFVILNYAFEPLANHGIASTYWYDSMDTVRKLESKREFYNELIKSSMDVDTQLELVQRNCIMLVNFLQNNNIKFYITNGFPTLKPSIPEKICRVQNHIIDYEFITPNGDKVKGAEFVKLTDPCYSLHQETNEYYDDFHQGLFVNKVVAKTIYNRLVDDKIITSEKENIDFNEWNTIKEKIKNNIGIL